MMKRFFSSLAIAIFAIMSTPVTTFAAEIPSNTWSWSDISSQLSQRNNRPVWAMAYGDNAWFYTDGQNLWNGGQAYRFDGSIQTNITAQVRNAGMDRVDDIVSDNASTVLFLQDVVRFDNQFRIVVFKNGSSYNATDAVRKAFATDEGISSINGQNGTWYIVTTKGRILSWDANQTKPTEITLPSSIRTNIDSTLAKQDTNGYACSGKQWLYSVLNSKSGRNSKPPIETAPMSNGDVLIKIPNGCATVDQNTRWLTIRPSNFSTKWYKVSNGTFVELTQLPASTNLVASNENHALFIQEAAGGINTHDLIAYDGTTLSLSHGRGEASNKTAVWTGTAWFITIAEYTDKKAYIFDPKLGDVGLKEYKYTYQETGLKTRDYFLTSATDGNGRVLLGGLTSTINTADPTLPLTAKLVMMTTKEQTTSSGSATTSNQSSVWTWIEPNYTNIKQNEKPAYHVGAWDEQGVKQIEIYVNGTKLETCVSSNTQGNQECAREIVGDNYPVGSTVSMQGLVIDTNGTQTWTNILRATIAAGDETTPVSTPTATVATSTSNVWSWVDETSIKRTESTTFYAQGSSEKGLKTMSIYVNGTLKKTCNFSVVYGTRDCEYTLNGKGYSVGDLVTIQVRAKDTSGAISLSTQSVKIAKDTDTTLSTPDITAWDWMSPEGSTVEIDETIEYHAGAWAKAGISYITVYANDIAVSTCRYYGEDAFGNKDCSVTIQGRKYLANSTIALKAVAHNRNGKDVWTTGKTIIVKPDTSATTGSTTDYVIVTTNRGSGFKENQGITIDAKASGYDGIERIEIYANGNRVKTCKGATSCSAYVMPESNSAYFAYSAKAVSNNGNIMLSGTTQLTKKK